MFSFYYLVNIERSQLPGDDYEHILVAFDDDNGIGIESESITVMSVPNPMVAKG